MKKLKFYLLAFAIVIVSAKLSENEALPPSEPAQHKPAVLNFLETLWKIVLSPFMLFFASLDYASQLGERTGAFLQHWYDKHLASPAVTEPPLTETNEIPPLVQNIPTTENTAKKRENILQRINAWVKSKTRGFKKSHVSENVTTAVNTTDWQYPSDLSEESVQDTNGLNWFFASKKLNVNEPTKGDNQTDVAALDSVSPANVTSRKTRVWSAARARAALVDKVRTLKARGRLAYDWILWKLMARQSALPTFFGKANSSDGYWNKRPSNPNLKYNPFSNSTSPYTCDDEPNPVCALDNVLGYTIFLNSCKMNLYNYDHQTNFTYNPTEVCLGLFIKYPDKFFKSKTN